MLDRRNHLSPNEDTVYDQSSDTTRHHNIEEEKVSRILSGQGKLPMKLSMQTMSGMRCTDRWCFGIGDIFYVRRVEDLFPQDELDGNVFSCQFVYESI